MLPLSHSDSKYKYNPKYKLVGAFRSIYDKIVGLLRLIISDINTRNLFFFLILNFSFAFVELVYGVLTNSLGLISDSFHMFFDCTGLVAGLVASVITKWRANNTFSFGYARAEVLAGFVNGLFLLFIAFFVLSEAVERAIEPPEVKHERMFVVSVLGFLVNLVGIYAFQHGHGSHGHSHSGNSSQNHSHIGEISHSHSHHGDSHRHCPYVTHPFTNYRQGSNSDEHSYLMTNSIHAHSHSNLITHNEEHDNFAMSSGSHIMKGVFLHILADTLGSVGIIISSILMHSFGWMRADPICSMFIAIMIAVSVFSLLKESVYILMQRQPIALDQELPDCYQKVMQLVGVYSIQEPHFWTLSNEYYIGTLKLEVSREADASYIVAHTQMIFSAVGVRQVNVQLDYTST